MNGRPLETDVPGHVRVPTAARMAGLSTREVYGLMDDGSLPARRDGKGLVVVPQAALESPKN